MHICGLNKTTLLDYPGRIACTIFAGGCNFRCPFCHNSGLVLSPKAYQQYTEEEVLAFLKKRRGILEGVCITGGEPTLDKGLLSFIDKIQSLGYPVKLDTNGSRPWILKKLVQNHLVDMVAMDIKSSLSTYRKAAGTSSLSLTPIQESVDYLLSGVIPYEFRTTAVRQLHTEEDFRQIGKWLAGCDAYYLQAYRDSPEVMIPGFDAFTKEEMESFRQILLSTISKVEIRGID